MVALNKAYKVKATFSETNEKKEFFFNAKSDAEIIELLKNSGFIEPFVIKEVNLGKPTPKQIEYASSLNIQIPLEATKVDLSALISKKTDNDDNPNDDLLEYATEKGLTFSRYIGTKALYELIFDSMTLNDKVAFFIFSVYKQLSDDSSSNLNKHKHKNLIYVYANELQTQEKIIKSICNYRGSELIHFGKVMHSDGIETSGGSVNTYAYKTVSEYVSKTFNTTKTKKINTERSSGYTITNSSEQKKGGCATVIVFIALIVIFIFVV